MALQSECCNFNHESTRFITGHVIYNLAYIYKFQLKTTKATTTLLLACSLLTSSKQFFGDPINCEVVSKIKDF